MRLGPLVRPRAFDKCDPRGVVNTQVQYVEDASKLRVSGSDYCREIQSLALIAKMAPSVMRVLCRLYGPEELAAPFTGEQTWARRLLVRRDSQTLVASEAARALRDARQHKREMGTTDAQSDAVAEVRVRHFAGTFTGRGNDQARPAACWTPHFPPIDDQPPTTFPEVLDRDRPEACPQS